MEFKAIWKGVQPNPILKKIEIDHHGHIPYPQGILSYDSFPRPQGGPLTIVTGTSRTQPLDPSPLLYYTHTIDPWEDWHIYGSMDLVDFFFGGGDFSGRGNVLRQGKSTMDGGGVMGNGSGS